MEKLFKSPPPPYIKIFPMSMTLYSSKNLTQQMGPCISEGEGVVSYTTFGNWGRWYEGDKKLKFYTFDLFTLSINIH